LDSDQFDHVARALSAALSRRTAFGVSVGTLLGALGSREATDAKKHKKKRKKKCKAGITKKCGTRCIPVDACCTSNDCPIGSLKLCRNGACVCPEGEVPCLGVCIQAGTCCVDTDCPTGGTCKTGACFCPPNEVVCGTTCANLATSGQHCRICNHSCASGDCFLGACRCENSGECPADCQCDFIREGGRACFASLSTITCVDSDDCLEFGSVCVSIGKCSNPCLA